MENTTETDPSESASSATHAALLSALSGSAAPFLPGETPPLASSTAEPQMSEVDRSSSAVEERAASVKSESHEKTATILPLSPPLTRPTSPSNAAEETAVDTSEVHGDAEPEEKDLTEEWHPLEHTRSDSRDMNLTQDSTFVDDSLPLETEEKNLSPPAPRAQRSNQSLRVEAKPPSPQPWDLVDPPLDNNGDATDYYSSLGTKNFGTLQKTGSSKTPIPRSTYYFGPPPPDAAYGTNPVGHIGVHHPREVFRVERDYTGGELVQFSATYPLELEGRITPTQFIETINSINEILISAHSIRHSLFNNLLAVFTLQISRLVVTSHYEKEMQRLEHLLEKWNRDLYNPVGLNIRWPREVAFLFLEIEYY